MIEATQIRTLAAQGKIDPGIIEKDYILSKVLMSLATLNEFREAFVFKGGTALKKCYYPDWRFSEDLDFTSIKPLTQKDIMPVFEKSVDKASRLFGVSLRVIEYSQYPKEAGPLTSAQLKVGYDGPLRKSSGQKNNVRVDIAFDEVVVAEPQSRKVFHGYGDDLEASLPVYPLEEILAEKLRSILQRGKSRDYYDVWMFLKNHSSDFSLERTRGILEKKCRHRGIPGPTVRDFLNPQKIAEAENYWERGLAHQLQRLPDFQSVLAELRILLPEVSQALDDQ